MLIVQGGPGSGCAGPPRGRESEGFEPGEGVAADGDGQAAGAVFPRELVGSGGVAARVPFREKGERESVRERKERTKTRRLFPKGWQRGRVCGCTGEGRRLIFARLLERKVGRLYTPPPVTFAVDQVARVGATC